MQSRVERGWELLGSGGSRALCREIPGGPLVFGLHGHGAEPDDLARLFDGLATSCSLVLPIGRLRTADGRRAFWPLTTTGATSFAGPASDDVLTSAAALWRAARARLDPPRTVLVGQSQGAAIALELCNHRPDALVVLSGAPLEGARFEGAAFASLPICVCHGRADEVVPFAAAEALVARLREAGAAVELTAYDGGHEPDASAVAAIERFIDRHLG